MCANVAGAQSPRAGYPRAESSHDAVSQAGPERWSPSSHFPLSLFTIMKATGSKAHAETRFCYCCSGVAAVPRLRVCASLKTQGMRVGTEVPR